MVDLQALSSFSHKRHELLSLSHTHTNEVASHEEKKVWGLGWGERRPIGFKFEYFCKITICLTFLFFSLGKRKGKGRQGKKESKGIRKC